MSIEYYSDMISHANDMNAYITSGKGKYKLSVKWVSDGNPNESGETHFKPGDEIPKNGRKK